MALIYYSGLGKDGDRFHRFDEVSDIDDIYDKLDRNDEELIQVVHLPSFGGLFSRRGRVKLHGKEVVEFCRQLAMYLDGGVDLNSIFQDLIAEPISRNLRHVVKKVAASLDNGYSLSSSLAATKSLPDIVITLVEIGEQSGSIGKSLDDAANYIERDMEVKAAAKRAFIYPTFTLAVMLAGLIVWIAFVIPQVVAVIKVMGVDLPLQTVLLLRFSDFVVEYWVYEIAFVILLVALFMLARRFGRGRYLLDRMWWSMPVMGPTVMASQMSFYFHYFNVLYDSGIPIIDILERLQRSVPNAYFRAAIKLSNENIRKGDPLQEGYKKAKVFEPLAIRIVGVGEKTGNLSKQLDLLTTIYLKRVQIFVETLPKVMEPVIIILIGIFFVIFASTLLGPLYEVITQFAERS